VLQNIFSLENRELLINNLLMIKDNGEAIL
jgi:hypothetical protein